jgi:nucleotide-binding universal stress UspA family protein
MEVAKNENVDLIMMGTKGASGVQEVIIGSNTEKIIRKSEIPVLSVHKDKPITEVKNAVVISDFKEDEDHQLITNMLAFLKEKKAKITFLRIVSPGSFTSTPLAEQAMKAFAKKYGVEDYTPLLYNHEYFEEAVKQVSKRCDADVLIMGTHARKGLAHLFYGSKAEDLVNHLIQPIYTYPIR